MRRSQAPDRVYGKVWIEAQNRKRFKAALEQRDGSSARELATYFAERLMSADPDPLEKRLWEVAVSYAEVTATGSARQQVRHVVRAFIKTHGIVPAVLELQAWAKPYRCMHAMIAGGAADLTCESVIVEFARQFEAETVRRARMMLAEHGSVFPNRG